MEIYFLPWLRFFYARRQPRADRLCRTECFPQHARFAYLLCFGGGGAPLAGSAGQRAPVAAAPVRENKFPTSQKENTWYMIVLTDFIGK